MCQDDCGKDFGLAALLSSAVLCLSSYNAHLLVRNQTFMIQLFSIGETLDELGASTIISYLLVHKYASLSAPLSLEMAVFSYPRTGYMSPILPWLHSSSYV